MSTETPTPAQAKVLSAASERPDGVVAASTVVRRNLIDRGWIDGVKMPYTLHNRFSGTSTVVERTVYRITAAGRAAIGASTPTVNDLTVDLDA